MRSMIIFLVLLFTDRWSVDCAFEPNFMFDDYDDYRKEFDYRFGRMSRSRSSPREDKSTEADTESQEQTDDDKELGGLIKQLPSMNAINRICNRDPNCLDSMYDYGYSTEDMLDYQLPSFPRGRRISTNAARGRPWRRLKKSYLRN